MTVVHVLVIISSDGFRCCWKRSPAASRCSTALLIRTTWLWKWANTAPGASVLLPSSLPVWTRSSNCLSLSKICSEYFTSRCLVSYVPLFTKVLVVLDKLAKGGQFYTEFYFYIVSGLCHCVQSWMFILKQKILFYDLIIHKLSIFMIFHFCVSFLISYQI